MKHKTACRDISKRLVLMGAPMEEGAGGPGTSLGPQTLCQALLAELVSRDGLVVLDAGNVAPSQDPIEIAMPGLANNATKVARWVRALAAASYQTLQCDEIPVFLGGDHALSIGTLAGISRYWAERKRELFVLWLDAHPDLNTPLTTPSGNLHGMALAAVIGQPVLAPLLARTGHVPIDPRNIQLFGIRAIDDAEHSALQNENFKMCGVHRRPWQDDIDELHAFLALVAASEGALHVSFDVDVLDPRLAPGVGTPVAGGFGYGDLLSVMRLLRQSGLVTSLDIVELNPLLDSTGGTASLVAGLVASLFSRRSGENPRYEQPQRTQESRHGYTNNQTH